MKAFRQANDLLKSGRVLTLFDDQLPLILAFDLSSYGLGCKKNMEKGLVTLAWQHFHWSVLTGITEGASLSLYR